MVIMGTEEAEHSLVINFVGVYYDSQMIKMTSLEYLQDQHLLYNQRYLFIYYSLLINYSQGASIVSGGLGALEVIGKKTVHIITEGDPGLRKKRAMIGGETKTLSQLLKEARDNNNGNSEDTNQVASSHLINYSQLIEQYGGND